MSRQNDDLHDPLISALYRDLPDAQPSAESDALIRAAARRAVHAGPLRKTRLFEIRTLTATAAMLLLGVGLVLHLQVREPQKFEKAISSQAIVEPASPSAITAGGADAPAQRKHRDTAMDRPKAATPARQSRSLALQAPPAAEAAPNEAAADAIAAAPAAPLQKAEQEIAVQEEGIAAASAPESSAPAPAAGASSPDSKQHAESVARRRGLEQTQERKAATAREAAKPAADYRQLMASGDYTEALATARPIDSPAATLDRDLLGMLLGQRTPPACSGHSALAQEDEALCNFIVLRLQGSALPADWRQQLEARGAISGERLYRRRAVEALFAP